MGSLSTTSNLNVYACLVQKASLVRVSGHCGSF
jgi:hypothetical protein